MSEHIRPGDLVAQIYDDDFGFRPTNASIKPVHVANGLGRALLARSYRSTALAQTLRRWVRNQRVGLDEERNPNHEVLERYGGVFRGATSVEVDLSRLTSFRALAWDVLGADQGVYENPDTSSYTLANERFLTRDPSDNRSGLFLAQLLTVTSDGPAATRIRDLLASATDPWTTLAWPLLMLAEQRLEDSDEAGADGAMHLFAQSGDGTLQSPTLRQLRTAYDRLAEFDSGEGSKLNALRRLVLFGCFTIHVHMCSRWSEVDSQAPRPPIFLDVFDGTRSSLRDTSRATLRAASDAIEGLIATRIRQHLTAAIGQDGLERWLGHLDATDPTVRTRYDAHAHDGQLSGLDALTEAMLETGIEANRHHPIVFLTELGRRAGYLRPWANAGRGGRLQKRYGVTAEFLEILVAATVEPDNPLEFPEFLDALRDVFGIVAGRWEEDEVIRRNNLRPGQFGMPVSVAEEDLRMNVEALRQALLHTGYAKSYADGRTIVTTAPETVGVL
jgi:hypothetical protein